MSNQVETLFTNIAETVNNRERSIRLSIWENGRDLAGVRDVLKPQGVWVAWQEKCLHISRQSVNNYIALYEADRECKTVLHHGASLSVLYSLAKRDNPQLQMQAETVRQKARQGEKLNDDDITVIMEVNHVARPEIRAAYRAANEVSPQTIRDIAITGAITDLDGDDLPIADADETLIRVQSEHERKERIMRHVETETITLRFTHMQRRGDKLIVVFIPPDGDIVDFKAVVRKPKAQPMEQAS